jgi:hypothetical protein
MSGRDRAISAWVILVLVICTCSLAVHFVAEGWASQAELPSFDMAVDGGDLDPDHEHLDDHFVFRSVSFRGLESSLAALIPQSRLHPFSVCISPLPPPPNF